MRFEKAQDPANTVRGLARAIELLREISPGIRAGGRPGRPEARDARRPPPIELPLDWLERKLGRAIDAAEVRGILERLEFGVAEPEPRRLLGFRAFLARHQRHLHQGRPGGRSRPHGGLRFHRAARAAGARRRAARQPRARVPARSARHVRGPGLHRGLQLLVPQRRSRARLRLRPRGRTCASPTPSPPTRRCMRTSLLPGIWRNVLENAKHRESFRLFEIGLEIHKPRRTACPTKSRTWPRPSTTARAMAPPACSRSSARPSA